ncbi:sigma 54-interacting transcriptional regulator, partial [Morganella morganii]|uniref:sigma 54-interacting transcriptional regulator n=1 Tax=Morganella morganii TaxID=582 RepID=UPI001FFDAD7B
VHSGALPGSTLESELFGHDTGAITVPQVQRQGLFERAAGGLFLLDEVVEIPADCQLILFQVV